MESLQCSVDWTSSRVCASNQRGVLPKPGANCICVYFNCFLFRESFHFLSWSIIMSCSCSHLNHWVCLIAVCCMYNASFTHSLTIVILHHYTNFNSILLRSHSLKLFPSLYLASVRWLVSWGPHDTFRVSWSILWFLITPLIVIFPLVAKEFPELVMTTDEKGELVSCFCLAPIMDHKMS